MSNPWIDSRVRQLRSADAVAYLARHGWQPFPQTDPAFREFDSPIPGDDAPTVLVPQWEQAGDFTQRMIELLTDLARIEQRSPGDILDGMSGTVHSSPQVNGSPHRPATAVT